MSVLIQDGRANGHRVWLQEAIERGMAQGAIVSPFATPPRSARMRPAASVLAGDMRARAAEFIFDATTHGFLLPGVDAVDIYGQWNLWAGDPGDLTSDALVEGHVERVFDVQRDLGAPLLVPTVPLDAAGFGPSNRTALALAAAGASNASGCWQSIAGSRTFWASGATLDAYVGELAQTRPNAWVLTLIRDREAYPPDTSDSEAEAGLCRTIHSLALRSRVIVAHSDFFGLPAIAAGASAIGSGWHGGQRVCSAASYRERSGGRNFRYVTHGRLLARLGPDVAEALDRQNAALARQLRDDQAYPVDDADARAMHLQALRSRADRVGSQSDRARSVEALREIYDSAQAGWTRLVAMLPGLVTTANVDAWVTHPRNGLERYALGEGL
jgi:hypothetical protein